MLFDRNKGVMYELNETASAVVDLLTAGTSSAAELVAALAGQFDADPEEIRADVQAMLEDFTVSGLVVARAVPEASVSTP
jgi:PqqD family protein of HPr-rel-A system